MWAVNYAVARIAPGIVSPHVLALGRWSLAGLILAIIARDELWRERKSTLQAWPQYIVLGFLGMLICGAWVYWAGETTTAINIALIYAASPVLITLGAVIGLKEPFSFKQGLGVVIALVVIVCRTRRTVILVFALIHDFEVFHFWAFLAGLRLRAGDCLDWLTAFEQISSQNKTCR
jgi:drug/metabolite transporter (DMT)-like permease